MECKDCISEISALLSALPKLWREAIASIICAEREIGGSVSCADVKKCQTLTSLSAFTVSGDTVSITYKDENGVSVTRSFSISTLIEASLDDVDPKCLTTPSSWQSLTFSDKIQLLVDKHCDCCDADVCPSTDNLAISTAIIIGQFGISWNSTNVETDPNVISVRLGKRVKATGGAFLTTGFTPANDIPKTTNSAFTVGLANTTYQFRLETICSEGGPSYDVQSTLGNYVEGIQFQCIAPQIIFDDTSAIVTVPLTNLDITRTRFTLRLSADSTIIAGPVEVSKSAGQCQTTFNGLDPSTSYYVELEFFAILNGVEVVSSSVNFMNSVCGPYVFMTSAAPTTTTTTTSTSTTSTTSTSSSTTTTTTICVTYDFKNNNAPLGSSIIVNYTDCNHTPQSEVIDPQITLQRCAIQGAYSGPAALSATQTSIGCVTTTTTSSTTTTTTVGPLFTIYVGFNNSGLIPDETAVLLGNTSLQDPLLDVAADFTVFAGTPRYCWVAIPSVDVKDHWFVTSLNQGPLGGSELFNTGFSTFIGGDPYLIYITNYQTEFTGICYMQNV